MGNVRGGGERKEWRGCRGRKATQVTGRGGEREKRENEELGSSSAWGKEEEGQRERWRGVAVVKREWESTVGEGERRKRRDEEEGSQRGLMGRRMKKKEQRKENK